MIRRMEKRDLDLVALLETRCFAEPWSRNILERGLRDSLEAYFVLETEEGIWGYASLCTIAGEAEIQRIAVDPGRRGRGYGKKLMDAMVSFARTAGVSAITLEVREGNTVARNLYRAYGFVEEAVRPNYYRNPTEDAVLMWRYSI